MATFLYVLFDIVALAVVVLSIKYIIASRDVNQEMKDHESKDFRKWD